MQPLPSDLVPQKKRHFFYFATVILLIGAIVAVVIQKQYESAVVVDVSVQHHIQKANFWGILNLATVALAILSWGIALLCHEKHRWMFVYVIVLLLFYVCLKLLIIV